MRIAFMLTSLGMGGAERQVTALAERMCARGHSVILVVLFPAVAEQWETQVRTFHLNMRRTPLRVVTGAVRAATILRHFRPDILHCHNFHGNLLGRMMKLALPHVCVISTIHNVYEGGRMRVAAYWASDFLSQRTVAVCGAAATRMVEMRAARQCGVIANGFDAGEFAPGEGRREGVRLEMDGQNKFIWMTAGRIMPAKGYETLLRAFARVHSAEECCELWIAGEGKSAYAARLRTIAAELGLRSAVRWLGLRRDVAGLLDAADGFVLASAWEGMPLALGEAMAMEKPVVATDVGGVRELLADCGMLVPAGDDAALAGAMLNVMHAGIEIRAAAGQVARHRMVSRFSMDANADAWEATYLSALNGRV